MHQRADYSGVERRVVPRRRHTPLADLTFAAWRHASRLVGGVRKTLGLVLLTGAVLAVSGVWAFTRVAENVREGATSAVDEAALRWVGAHRITVPWMEHAMVEITALGTAVVVLAVVGISALFLFLTHHRYSAGLLLVSTGGGIVLNSLLKLGFQRPRPDVIEWGTHAMSSSFPSGHAMSAAIAYGTVGWLAARLAPGRRSRLAILLVAALLVVLISLSRIWLGVHYPSDVLAGFLVGIAWAGFCMVCLEAMVIYARRRAPAVLEDERPPEEERKAG